MMKKIKNKKSGISLIVLIITISVMLILLSIVIISVGNASENAKLSSFATDLATIEDLTTAYQIQNDKFPTRTEDEVAKSQKEILDMIEYNDSLELRKELKLNNDYNEKSEDLGAFYVIDLSKLDIDSSKRGTLKDGDTKDVYVVAYPSMNVYYLKGVKAKKNIYFSLSSKLTNRVKIERNMEYKDNSTTIQSIEGLTVKKINKSWTNSMGIYVIANLASDEKLSLDVSGVGNKELTTNVGTNEFNFDDLSQVKGFTQEESEKFKKLNGKDKKITFIKTKNSQEVGKIEVDMSNYEVTPPVCNTSSSGINQNIKYNETNNIVSFNVSDDISGVKEVRYEYLTKYDENGNVQNYYNGVTEYDTEYLKSRGKKAIPDSNGNVALKVDKDIQGIQVIIIDKAGNVNTGTLKVAFYEYYDIYIGLNVKEKTDNRFAYEIVLANKEGISNVSYSVSSDGINYTNEKTKQPNTGAQVFVTKVEDSYENMPDIKFLKVSATNSSYSYTTTSTRIFEIEDKDKLELGKIVDETITFNLKKEGTYYNPVIPKGFAPINEGNAKWGTADGWANGLVIKDEKGNEFVWIPVQREEDYKKDFTFPSNYSASESNTSDDTLPNGIEDETVDVKKYGGFYIARYEAGTPEGKNTPSNEVGTPVSKKGAVVWTNITYDNAKKSAEQMINNDSVQTGLLTGKAWDTTCHYIEDYVKKITDGSSLSDSRYYGNYSNSLSPANVGGYGTKQKSGYSDKWMVKNIYDLAGNVGEWTNEKGQSYGNSRGGSCDYSGDIRPVTSRNSYGIAIPSNNRGFRVRLYIK